jgi:hypothetical protein
MTREPVVLLVMSSQSTRERPGTDGTRTVHEPVEIPGVAHWLVAGLLALVGAALLVGGTAVVATIDRSMFVEMVARGEIVSTLFTRADLATISHATAWWTGIGLLVTGIAVWAAGAAYLIGRRRQRAAVAGGEVPEPFVTNAFLGGVAGLVLFFVPFSQIVGGGLSGYLERADASTGAKVGLLAGVFSAAPVALLLVFVLGGLAVGAASVGASIAALFVAVTLLAIIFVLVVGGALGALGGYIGTRLTSDRARTVD